MITVEGYDEGTYYAVQIGAPDDQDVGVREGLLSGSATGMAVVVGYVGQTVDVSPTGPTFRVSLDDPASILAVLHTRTQVISVDGDDIPEVLPPLVPGAVY